MKLNHMLLVISSLKKNNSIFIVCAGLITTVHKFDGTQVLASTRPVASKFWLVRPGSGCGLWLINLTVVT